VETSLDELSKQFGDGRTDLVEDLIGLGVKADGDILGVPLVVHCAYYGDVSALRLALRHGARLEQLGHDYGLMGASFHGHWQLCQFLLENGANANVRDAETGETPLHSALCTANRTRHDRVLQVLLSFGADPKVATIPGVETGGFMRDVRTRGETPLHRAAAFGTLYSIDLLIRAGADIEARDVNGDSPLSWASWYLRPAEILRPLCFGGFRIRPDYKGMDENLAGYVVPRPRE
jgi:ankyrin repeat protein